MLFNLLQTQAAADTAALAETLAAPVQEKTLNLIDMAAAGGLLMIVLLLLSVMAIYIFGSKWWMIHKASQIDKNFMKDIHDLIHDGKIKSATDLCQRYDSPVARLVEKGIERIGRPLQDIQTAVENMGNVEIARLEKATVAPSEEVNAFLVEQGSSPISTGIKLAELLRRPEISYLALAKIDTGRPVLPRGVIATAEVQIKYDGYIKRELAEVERHKKLEERRLPEDISYKDIVGLRLEAAEKLERIRPMNIGQASRISGVSPADVSVLLIYLSSYGKK